MQKYFPLLVAQSRWTFLLVRRGRIRPYCPKEQPSSHPHHHHRSPRRHSPFEQPLQLAPSAPPWQHRTWCSSKECAGDVVTEACEDFVALHVVAASEPEEELVELDDAQPLKDDNFGRQYAGSPCVSPRSCDGAHREGLERGLEDWPYGIRAPQGEHESHHWPLFWRERSQLPTHGDASLQKAVDHECPVECHRASDVLEEAPVRPLP